MLIPFLVQKNIYFLLYLVFSFDAVQQRLLLTTEDVLILVH